MDSIVQSAIVSRALDGCGNLSDDSPLAVNKRDRQQENACAELYALSTVTRLKSL